MGMAGNGGHGVEATQTCGGKADGGAVIFGVARSQAAPSEDGREGLEGAPGHTKPQVLL